MTPSQIAFHEDLKHKSLGRQKSRRDYRQWKVWVFWALVTIGAYAGAIAAGALTGWALSVAGLAGR